MGLLGKGFEKGLKKSAKTVLKNKKRAFLAFVIAILVVGGIGFWFNDSLLFEFVDSVNEKTFNVAAVGHARHSLLKAGDELNLFKAGAFMQDFGLKEFEFELSGNDLKYFQDASKESMNAGYKPETAKNYRDVKLKVDGEKYNVKIALHGDTLWNFAGQRKSFKVKTSKEEYLNGLRRFNLVLPENRGFILCLFAEEVSEKLGLFSLGYEMVSVKINGVPQGIYLLEEGLDEKHTERNQRPETLVLEISDNWIEDHPIRQSNLSTLWRLIGGLPSGSQEYGAGVITGKGHNTPFDLEISNFREVDFELKEEVEHRLWQFLEVVESEDQERLEEFVDLDRTASFLALQALLGEVHDFTGDNLRILYDTTTGKFWFSPRSEGSLSPLETYKGGIERSLSSNAGEQVPMLSYLLRNEKLRHLRNEKIYGLLEERKWVVETFTELDEKKYRPMLMNDSTSWLSSRETNYYLNNYFGYLKGNLGTLQRQFDYGKVYVNAVSEGSVVRIEVIPDSTTALRFEEFGLELETEGNVILRVFDGKGKLVFEESRIVGKEVELAEFLNKNIIQAGLGKEMEPVNTEFVYEIEFLELEEVKFSIGEIAVKNAISEKRILEEDVYVKTAFGKPGLGLQNKSKEEFLEFYPELGFEEMEGKLVLNEGVYEVERNVIIPKGLNIEIGPGAEIRIGAGKSIVSYSGLNILGSEEMPVIVSRLDPEKAFGVLGIIGEEGKTKTVMRNFEIEGGNEAFVNGIYFSGQLSVYHSDLELVDSKIRASASDDGLNVKYGKIRIENVEFAENAFDQVDLDFCSGTVEKSTFFGLGNANGDGLDVSGSDILAIENNFEGFGDKGLSIGEKSWVLAYKNNFLDNNMGSAVKDLSQAYFLENVFSNNLIPIAAYEKKPLFGGAKFFIYENELAGNENGFSIDEKSSYRNLSIPQENLKSLFEMLEERNLNGLKELLYE